MQKYVIERELAGAGELTPEQLQDISQKSCGTLNKLGPQTQWLESFVTDNKIYCVYIAPDAAMVHEHATQGGFPANRVSTVKAIIDPTTAGAQPGTRASGLWASPLPNVAQKKIAPVAKQQNRWLLLGFISGIATMVVTFGVLKDLRPFRRIPIAQQIQGEAPQASLAWQSRIWKEGFSAGERQVQSGGEFLDLDAIDQRSSEKFPADFTADVLWSIGFESGQAHATRPKQ